MSDAPLQPSTIAVLLGATAVIVTEELRGLGLDAGWRPAPGEWSASECVGHLIEAAVSHHEATGGDALLGVALPLRARW